MRRGPKPRKDVMREPNGRISRSRQGRLKAGTMVYADYAVYFAQTLDAFTKIGFSGNLQNRMSQLTTANGEKLRIAALVLVPTERLARKLENTMHRRFASQRHRGEWFNVSEADIRAALSDCRKLGLKTVGLEAGQVSTTPAPFSSLIGAQDRPALPAWLREVA